MKKLLVAGGTLALVAVIIIGLSQSTGTSDGEKAEVFTAKEIAARLAGAPAPLAALHAQGSELLPGGRSAFRARMKQLRGYPVVVSKWASWCGPCRVEFPSFQRLSVEYGKQVAFVSLNSGDNADDAREFLDEFPIPYPSYVDPRVTIAQDLGPANYFPLTAFYDRAGKRAYVHAGVYSSTADLRDDIERYALGGG